MNPLKKATDTPRFESRNSRDEERGIVSRKSSKSQLKEKSIKKKSSNQGSIHQSSVVGQTQSSQSPNAKQVIKKSKKLSENVPSKKKTSSRSASKSGINQLNTPKSEVVLSKKLLTSQASIDRQSPSPISYKLSSKKSPDRSHNYSLVSVQSPASKKQLNKSKTENSILKFKNKSSMDDHTSKKILNISQTHSKKASMMNTQEDGFGTQNTPKEQNSKRYETNESKLQAGVTSYQMGNDSESSSSDNEFDVILSPRVLRRMQEQSQKAYDATNLNKESEFIVSKKIDDWKRERLEKEYKCLFYKTREISEMLLDSQKANSQFQKDIDEKEQIYELTKQKYKQCKELLKEIKQSLLVKDQQNVEVTNKEVFLQNEVESLTKSVKEYKSQVKSIENELQKVKYESNNEKSTFVEKMKLLKEQLSNQKEEEVKKTQNIEKIEVVTQKKVELLQNQNQSLSEKLQLTQDKYDQDTRILKQEIMEIEGKYQNELKQMQYKENHQFEIINTLERERDKLANQIEQLLSTNTKYQLEVTDMQKSLKDEKEDYYKFKEENQILILKNQNAQEQFDDLKRKNEVLKKKINELEEQIFKLKNEKFEEKLQLENAINQSNSAQISVQNLKKEQEQEKQQRDQLQLDLIKYKELSNGLERENKLLKDDLNTKNQEIERIRESKERIEEQLRRELEDIKSVKREQESKLKKKDTKLSKLRDEMDDKIKRLNEKNLILENELILEKRSIDDKFTSIEELQKNFEQQILQNKMMQQERARVEEMMKSLEFEQKSKNDQNQNLQIRINELEKQISNTQDEKESFKNKYMFSKYETRKIKDDFIEKENKLKSVYDSQVEQFNYERDQFIQHRIEEDSKKKVRDSKMKVLGDIKDMIKHHKDKLKPF